MARLLVISPYPGMFPPRNGGNLRAFYLLRELSRNHEVHAVSRQRVDQLTGTRDGYQFPSNVRTYGPGDGSTSRSVFSLLPQKLGSAIESRWIRADFRSAASTVLLETHRLVRRVLENNQIDVVIFNVLETLALLPLVRRLAPDAVRIINTENVDHQLIAQEMANAHARGRTQAVASLERTFFETLRQESSLYRLADGFWAASEEDKKTLHGLNRGLLPGFVVPNGVDTAARPFDPSRAKTSSSKVIFCGSFDYFPNREGVTWFCRTVWPLVVADRPDARLILVGRGFDNPLDGVPSDPTIQIVGEVESVIPYYHNAGVSVAPLLSGSGTKLKVLEAMSLGNPLAATSAGISGLSLREGRDCLIGDTPQSLAAAILRLMAEPALFESLRAAARDLVVKRYDWAVSGISMDHSLRVLMENRAHHSS